MSEQTIRPHPLTIHEQIRRRQRYVEETEPYVQLQSRLMCQQPFRITIPADPDSTTPPKREILWRPEDKELFDRLSECVEQIARGYTL